MIAAYWIIFRTASRLLAHGSFQDDGLSSATLYETLGALSSNP